MSRPRHASRISALILSIAGVLMQASIVTCQSSATPPQFELTPELGQRLAEAAEDSELALWQREFMLEMARGRAEGALTDPTSAVPDVDWPSAGIAADDGAWIGVPPLAGREGHSAIHDPVRDRMVVFGGGEGSTRDDVWVLSLTGNSAWSALETAGDKPAARSGHTAIYDPVRDRMVVFGGFDSGGLRNDVWALSLAGNPAWIELGPTGVPPPERSGHTAIYDPIRDRMAVFGGLSTNIEK